ncbi:MAG: cysteine--tRNA ligase [Thaumarchaeota archaeon]|nr:cysteine--tRNA ligase [Nitrososphaerota archaeon]
MALRFRNTLGRKVQPFRTISKGKVRMYTCGPTVWNYAHVGNLRTFVFEDLLRRYLKLKGYEVTQVMNITDVEDKIINGMRRFKMTRRELSDFYEKAFLADIATLGVEKVERYPRATEHIAEMVALINRLIKKGYAYKAADGSVYFAVRKFRRYGALSGIRPKELKAGARVSQDHYEKEEANDFALWKAWDHEDGEVFWETELGKGRPGWHIECSAMSMKYLGESFDIHTGGLDNRFPHHENEIAQSEAATGKKFVRYWLHAGLLSVAGEDMHKSVGNVVYLKDLIRAGRDPRVIRLFLISSRYRDPMDLTDAGLDQAKSQRARLQELVSRLRGVREGGGSGSAMAGEMLRDFEVAMDDDLNTPAALATLFSWAKRVNALIDRGSLGEEVAASLLDGLRRIDSVLGVLQFEEETLSHDLAALVADRESARKRRDFAESDRLRARLREKGIVVEDTPGGQVWKRADSG